MNKPVIFITGWLLALVPALASAAPSASAQREIDALISGLASSPCQFQRNGNWYDGNKASAHLQRKYDYLLRKDLVETPEQFIARAGSQSSISGRAYQVRCPGQPIQPAAEWFQQQLQRIRVSTPTSPASR